MIRVGALLASPGLASAGYLVWQAQAGPGGAKPLEGVDIATIVLGAASLIVTAVGVIIAVVALIGYKQIQRAAVKAAEQQATKTAETVASAVAARVARETPPAETSVQEATEIVQSLSEEDLSDGRLS